MKAQRLTDIKDILKANYIGYIWGVSQKEPIIFEGDRAVNIFDTIDSKNPFIVEGLLYDPHTNTSYHILHTHRYIITKFEREDTDVINQTSYLSHKIYNKRIVFEDIWVEENDDQCNNFPVLKLKAQVFKGFQ